MTVSRLDSVWPRAVRTIVERTAGPDDARLRKELGESHRLGGAACAELYEVYLNVAAWLELAFASGAGAAAPVIGINGPQGSGKSTAAAFLKSILERRFGRSVCVLSVDDIYLGSDRRGRLAREVHPLLATRGVPGTHDTRLGERLIGRLQKARHGSTTTIPRFDKAADEPYPEAQWDRFDGRPDFILFEGWCVGALPEPPDRLEQPVNRLERQEDADGVWRTWVNRRLREYQSLFQVIDRLIMLKAPSFEQVYQWRLLQERKLAESNRHAGRSQERPPAIMDEVQLRRFVMHFERLTRWLLEEMPSRADMVLTLDAGHCVTGVTLKGDAEA